MVSPIWINFAFEMKRKNLPYYFIIVVVGLLSVSCSSGKKLVRNDKEAISMHRHHGSSNHLTGLSKKLVDEAMTWQGTPYKYGGAEKGEGTDCSGLVLRVYEKVTGVKMPRNSLKQAEFCKKLKPGDAVAGDLVFFATGKDPDRISHVGLMLDDDRFIHSSTSKGVCISSVSTPYYTRTFKMYGRVPQ